MHFQKFNERAKIGILLILVIGLSCTTVMATKYLKRLKSGVAPPSYTPGIKYVPYTQFRQDVIKFGSPEYQHIYDMEYGCYWNTCWRECEFSYTARQYGWWCYMSSAVKCNTDDDCDS